MTARRNASFGKSVQAGSAWWAPMWMGRPALDKVGGRAGVDAAYTLAWGYGDRVEKASLQRCDLQFGYSRTGERGKYEVWQAGAAKRCWRTVECLGPGSTGTVARKQKSGGASYPGPIKREGKSTESVRALSFLLALLCRVCKNRLGLGQAHRLLDLRPCKDLSA